MIRRTALYRLYDADGQLLYIGVAYDPQQRWYSHANTAPWWPRVARREVTWYPHRPAAEDAERDAIRAEAPMFNVAWATHEPIRLPAKPKQRHAVSEETRAALSAAADTYVRAPIQLKEAILEASDGGKSVAEITRAIEHTYTADYVARLVREHKKDKADDS